jgi:hypothetical protein
MPSGDEEAVTGAPMRIRIFPRPGFISRQRILPTLPPRRDDRRSTRLRRAVCNPESVIPGAMPSAQSGVQVMALFDSLTTTQIGQLTTTTIAA